MQYPTAVSYTHLFINKPVGMLSQKAKPQDESLVEHIVTYLLKSGQLKEEELLTFRPSICNRLDRNTSGIIAAGKTLAALQQLNAGFKKRTIQKQYLCLVKGQITASAHIRGVLVKDRTHNKVTILPFKIDEAQTDVYRKEEAYIETEYQPIATADDSTLLKVHLILSLIHIFPSGKANVPSHWKKSAVFKTYTDGQSAIG